MQFDGQKEMLEKESAHPSNALYSIEVEGGACTLSSLEEAEKVYGAFLLAKLDEIVSKDSSYFSLFAAKQEKKISMC